MKIIANPNQKFVESKKFLISTKNIANSALSSSLELIKERNADRRKNYRINSGRRMVDLVTYY